MTENERLILHRLSEVEAIAKRTAEKVDTLVLLLFGSLVTVCVFALGTIITLLTTRGGR